MAHARVYLSGRSGGTAVRWLKSCAGCGAGVVLAVPMALAQPQPPQLPQGSAVAQTVLGIISYTQWPTATAELDVCLAGEPQASDEVLLGASIAGGRKVLLRHLSAPYDLQGCEVLYAGLLPQGQWQALMAAWPAGQPLLTISEDAAACRQGGMFCLSITAANVSFELNLDSMARSGVRVSPRVFGLTRRKEGA